MNKEIKEKWLEALRSGEYKQGREHLRDESNQFCCLGVLCDIVDPKGWTDAFSFRGSSGEPRTEDCEELEITEFVTDLVNMNDADEESFAQIADWIEVNL